MKEEPEVITINNFDDLLNFTKRLFQSIGDFGQYTKCVIFLQKLREEYRFWMSEHDQIEFSLTLPTSSSIPSPFRIILVKRKEEKK